MPKEASRAGVRDYLLLHVLLLVYSLYALLSKLAAAERFLSLPFLGLFGGALLLMAVYALFWQRILKRLPLSTAFSSKSVVIIWGMVWGAVFFAEGITVPKLIGAVLVMLGIWLAVGDGK